MVRRPASFIATRTAESLRRRRQPSRPYHVAPTLLTGRSQSISTSAASASASRLVESLPLGGIVGDPLKLTGSVAGVLSILALLKYWGAIKRQLQLVREESWIFGAGVTMERVVADANPSGKDGSNSNNMMRTGAFQQLSVLELNDDFKRKCEAEGWKLLALGDYMSQLRPKGLPKRISVDDMPMILQREIEAGLAAGLLKVLGPNMGRALLPAVGTGFVQKKAQGLATRLFTGWFASQDGAISQSNDKGGIPVGLLSLLAIADANAKLNSGGGNNTDDDAKEALADELLPGTQLTAMAKMKAGEVVKGPSFVDDAGQHLVPNNFILDQHFDRAIRGMEARLSQEGDYGGLGSTADKIAQEEVLKQEQEPMDAINMAMGQDKKPVKLESEQYDPEDRSLAQPVPANPRLFPDLHMGYAGALNSHTKREVLKMRLISILLNKLGANYYRRANGETGDLFTVRMSQDGEPITTPGDFVQALIDAGHHIDAVPASRLTTFGGGMCVKEPDGSWTNIPLGVFIESGYEDRHGNMAPAMLPHSGLNMYISGPLAGERADGTPSKLVVQHFIGIEGFCGWQSHAQADIPFNEDVMAGVPVTGKDAVRAARIAALYANSLNGLATELNLPFGGYGSTAVCNDSAAIVQQCLYGETTIYPMTSIGKFMQRTMRYAQNLSEKLEAFNVDGTMGDEIRDLDAIAGAMRKIPSDINASPSNAKSAAQRLLHTLQPKMPFIMMTDAKRVAGSILEEEERAGEESHPRSQTKSRKSMPTTV